MKSKYNLDSRKNFDDEEPLKLHPLWAFVLIFAVALIYGLSYIAFYNLPSPRDQNDTTNADHFIAQRAKNDLEKLVKLGPKIVGYAPNEQEAIKLLTDTIEEIKATANSLYDIEYNLQIASGGYVRGTASNLYSTIQNVVVKLSPKNIASTDALLINTHFDTVPSSPGAGDAGTMVVVMLECLRVLSRSTVPVKNSIIFLFNGAEENGLQGSHAFITQHKWAKNVKALINLDATGTGGKEILFQTGPGNPWLSKYYYQNAIHPYASTIGEEVFQNNLIPSDTDFRIFRDYGEIVGLDLAYAYNDYVYHTKYDRIEIIPDGTYQHTGDNILAVARALANAPELNDPTARSTGHAIFFDVFGLFMIYYTESDGVAINISLSVFALIFLFASAWFKIRNSEVTMINFLYQFLLTMVAQVLALGISIALIVLLAIFVDGINYSLSWFSQTWLIFGLYYCPFVFVMALTPALFLSYNKFNFIPFHYGVQLFMEAHCFILVILIYVLTSLYIRSTFLLTLSVMFFTASLMINLFTNFQTRPFLWVLAHLIGQAIPLAFYSYISIIVYSIFIPISGRNGLSSNPEIMIALCSIGLGLLMIGFIAPVFSLFRKAKLIITGFIIVTVIFIILMVTPICFPYTAETAPQRHTIQHTKRTFNNYEGRVRKEDAGYYMITWDRHSENSLRDFVGDEIKLESAFKDCDVELLCGLPHYSSGMRSYVSTGLWAAADSPVLKNPPSLKVRKIFFNYQNHKEYNFQMTGTKQTQIFIQPLPGIRLVDWSFPAGISAPDKNNVYFLMMRSGLSAAPFDLTLRFEVPSNHKGAVFNIALVGHYQNNNYDHTEPFKKFLSYFPSWTVVDASVSSYESWQL